MIPGIAEYININVDTEYYHMIFDKVAGVDSNTFGKTKWNSFALEDNRTGIDTEYSKDFKRILSEQKSVHPYMQKRSTGFNYANTVEKDLFIHSDVDLDTEHPKHFNLIIPIYGKALISYYKTKEEDIWLPEKNAHGFAYYHEFKKRLDDDYEDFKRANKIGEIIVEPDKPVLLDTFIMHGVEIIESPRLAWCSRWNNIPVHYDFYSWKARVENILK